MKKQLLVLGAAAIVVAAAVPAMADTSLYGSARVTTFWNSTQAEPSNNNDMDLNHSLQANSRLGVNFSNEKLGGKVEIGVGTASVGARHIYGTYKFDSGTILVGQTENPYYVFSAQVAGADNVNNNYGALWDTRQAQVKFTLNNGLYLALIQPTTNAGLLTAVNSTAAQTNFALTNTDTYLPKISLGYNGKAGNFSYGVGVVGQTFTVDNTDTAVNSLMGYTSGKLTAGAFGLLYNFGYGINTGNMGFTNANGATTAAGSAGSTNMYDYTNRENTTSMEGYVQASFTASPTLKLNVGVGYAEDQNDRFMHNDNRMTAFINAPITIAKGFIITPEFTYIDQMTQSMSNDKGNKAYLAGAQWRMDF